MTPNQQFEAFESHVLKISEDRDLLLVLGPLVAKLKMQLYFDDGAQALDMREELARLARHSSGRGQEAYVKFLPALEILSRVWGTAEDYKRADEVAISPDQLIRIHIAKLNDFKNFACSDSRRYAGAIVGNKQAVFDKTEVYETWARSHFDAEASANAYGAKEKYTVHDIAAGGGMVLLARSACCSTFSLAAAYVLTGGQRNTNGVRVECVAIPGFHCFVVIGRAGGFVEGLGQRYLTPAFDDSDTMPWGDNAIIVDAWYGSMGNEVVYRSPFADYPSRGQLDRLESKFDSTEMEKPKTNPFAGILATKKKAELKCPKCASPAADYSSPALAMGAICTNSSCGHKGKRSDFLR